MSIKRIERENWSAELHWGNHQELQHIVFVINNPIALGAQKVEPGFSCPACREWINAEVLDHGEQRKKGPGRKSWRATGQPFCEHCGRRMTWTPERYWPIFWGIGVRPRYDSSQRHIPSEVEREIWRLWGGVCPFTGEVRTELHHILPYTLYGAPVIDNIIPISWSLHRRSGGVRFRLAEELTLVN